MLDSNMSSGFRPLAGISCFIVDLFQEPLISGFRPLAGISCFVVPLLVENTAKGFSSPSGD